MAVIQGQLACKLYPSAFSGEVVFQIDTVDNQSYEGVAPNHYITSDSKPTKDGVDGQVKVHILKMGKTKMRVSMPDSQILDVSADRVRGKK